jgi:hypothetical protein
MAKGSAVDKTVSREMKEIKRGQSGRNGRGFKAFAEDLWPAFNKIPKGVVEWPWRYGSAQLFVFQRCLQGVKASELEKQITAHGHAWPYLLRQMRRCAHKQHTWRLREDGMLKIENVKYHGETEDAPPPVVQAAPKKKHAKATKKAEPTVAAKPVRLSKKDQKKAAKAAKKRMSVEEPLADDDEVVVDDDE